MTPGHSTSPSDCLPSWMSGSTRPRRSSRTGGTKGRAFRGPDPAVASSDATNSATTITRDGDGYVINGRKWWSSGAMDPNCRIFIVMGVTGGAAEGHGRHSMILVPRDTPGIAVQRGMTVVGFTYGRHGG